MKQKNTQVDFTLYETARQLKLPMETEIFIAADDPVRLVSAVVERMDIRKIERSYSQDGRNEYPPRIAEDYLESIDHSHDKLRKASVPIMRSRALYGELLTSSMSLEEYCDEQGKFRTENDILFSDVVKHCVHSVSKGKKEYLLGQPLEEVDARLKDIVAIDAAERKSSRKRST